MRSILTLSLFIAALACRTIRIILGGWSFARQSHDRGLPFGLVAKRLLPRAGAT
jgi:hypothetical protein